MTSPLWLSLCMVMGVRPVSQRSLVHIPLLSLEFVCCALGQGNLSILSQSTQLKLGFNLQLTIVSIPWGDNFHLLRTTETGDMHRPYAPNGTEKDLTNWYKVGYRKVYVFFLLFILFIEYLFVFKLIYHFI